MDKILRQLMDRELAALGYAKQKGARFGRRIEPPGGAPFDESFFLQDLGTSREGLATAELYAGIFFPDMPEPLHFEMKRMPEMHWEWRANGVADVPEEWKFEKAVDASTAVKFRDAVLAASARFQTCTANFRLLVAAGLGETAYPRLRELIASGLDVNDGGALLTTPLIEAAARSYMPSVKALIDAGADPTIERGGFTASHAAFYLAEHFHHPSDVGPYLRELETRAKQRR